MRRPPPIPGAHALAWLVALSLVTASAGVARAAEVDASAVVREAEAREAALDFRGALERYEAVVAGAPSSPEATTAAARLAALRAHAEGDFAPLARLERVRRDPAATRDAASVDALVRDADGFPPGLVRVEAWALAAEAYAERLDRAREAEELRLRILDDPAADPITAAKIARDAADAAIARGDVGGAERALEHARGRVTSDVVDLVARAKRRVHVRRASLAAVVVTIAAAAIAIARAARSRRLDVVVRSTMRTGRVGLLFAAWIAVTGGLLALGYDDGDARPFLALGTALVPTFLVARAWGAAEGATSPLRRSVRAAICACAALGVAFLVLEGTNATYLTGLGL